MEKRDLLQIWGVLQAFKDTEERKAKEAAARQDEAERQLSAGHLKTAAEIAELQKKIDCEVAKMEGGVKETDRPQRSTGKRKGP